MSEKANGRSLLVIALMLGQLTTAMDVATVNTNPAFQAAVRHAYLAALAGIIILCVKHRLLKSCPH